MVYLIPSVTDLEYNNGQALAKDPIKSRYAELQDADYKFKGWITSDKLKDLIYPYDFEPKSKITRADSENAFYVDKDICLWMDCSENSEESHTYKRDLCIRGRNSELSFETLEKEGVTPKEGSIVSSVWAREAGYFFKLPIGAQLSAKSNSNFHDLIQLNSDKFWKTSFSFDMWMKPSNARDVLLTDPHQEIPNRLVNLLLMCRSQDIGGKWARSGYDFYFKMTDGFMQASNFNPTDDPNYNIRNTLQTSRLSCCKDDTRQPQPGAWDAISNEWSNIAYGWTYFAFSYNASTSTLVGLVKSNNAHFECVEPYLQSKSSKTVDANSKIPDSCRDYGVLVGNLHYTYENSAYCTPETSVKLFRVYERALPLSSFEKIYDIEKKNFRPDKIRTRFHSLSVNREGDLAGAALYPNGKNGDDDMFATVYPLDPSEDDSQWTCWLRLPRNLHDYWERRTTDRFMEAPNSCFVGWSINSNAGNVVTAEHAFEFAENATKNLSVMDGGGHLRELYAIVRKRVIYHKRKGGPNDYVIADDNPDHYVNFGVSIKSSKSGNVVEEYDGMTRVINDDGGGWTTKGSTTLQSSIPTRFMEYSQQIGTWALLNSILTYSGDLHLFPIYKKVVSLTPINDFELSTQIDAPGASGYKDENISSAYRPYGTENETKIFGLTIPIYLYAHIDTGNDHPRSMTVDVSVCNSTGTGATYNDDIISSFSGILDLLTTGLGPGDNPNPTQTLTRNIEIVSTNSNNRSGMKAKHLKIFLSAHCHLDNSSFKYHDNTGKYYIKSHVNEFQETKFC